MQEGHVQNGNDKSARVIDRDCSRLRIIKEKNYSLEVVCDEDD